MKVLGYIQINSGGAAKNAGLLILAILANFFSWNWLKFWRKTAWHCSGPTGDQTHSMYDRNHSGL